MSQDGEKQSSCSDPHRLHPPRTPLPASLVAFLGGQLPRRLKATFIILPSFCPPFPAQRLPVEGPCQAVQPWESEERWGHQRTPHPHHTSTSHLLKKQLLLQPLTARRFSPCLIAPSDRRKDPSGPGKQPAGAETLPWHRPPFGARPAAPPEAWAALPSAGAAANGHGPAPQGAARSPAQPKPRRVEGRGLGSLSQSSFSVLPDGGTPPVPPAPGTQPGRAVELPPPRSEERG